MSEGHFRSVRTRQFKVLFDALPARVRQSAINRYKEYFLKNPRHELLERHTLHDVGDAYPGSIAVNMYYGYRAVAFFVEEDHTYVWYWCGSHAEYDRRFRKGR